MSSSTNYYIRILTDTPRYLHQYVATVLYIIGNLGNFLSLLIFFKRSWRKNVCVFYFIICLLSNTVFINSGLLGTIFVLGFNINAHHSSVVLCKLFYYISYLSSLYYPFVLIFASFDRLLISSQNVDTRLYSSKRLAYLSICTNTFIWSIFSLHILIEANIQEIYPTVFICYYSRSKFYLNFVLYSSLVLSVLILLILSIFSILAFKNVRRIRAIPRQQRNQLRTMNKKDFQLLRCLYIHNIIYIIFSILILVSVCYSTTLNLETSTPMEKAINNFLSGLGDLLHSIPYCTSIFIFVSVSKAFRQEMKRLGYKICGKNVPLVREEDNQQQQPARDNMELHNVVVSTIAVPR